jgi:hypothetical protein
MPSRTAPWVIFPTTHLHRRFGKRCFELLREAYVKARYSMHYPITTEELTLLIERVTELQAVVETVCRERLAELEGKLARQGLDAPHVQSL